MKTRLLAVLLCAGLAFTAQARVDVREFRNAAEEQRYQALIDELRCPKCQNTNLSGSDAELAEDLKNKVFRLMRDGRSDAEIRDYLVARYGDFITYKPPFRAGTLLLWVGPALLLGIAGLLLVLRAPSRAPRQKPLSPDEHARLQQLLSGRSEPDAKP